MDRSIHFLHIKEGMAQGDPISMMAYGIGILPLIRELHAAHPHFKQPWYADDTGAGGKLETPQEHIRDMMVRGPL